VNARPTLPILVLALSFLVLVQGCSSDDSTGPGNGGTSPFSGAWDVEGVVTAKQTCGREIGDTLEWEVLIAADGDHGVISFGGPPRELVISGPTATASWLEESAIDVELTLSGGALGGTVTSTSRIGPPGT
jgi:hypothetical protein